jgi:ankyrin repeat protein
MSLDPEGRTELHHAAGAGDVVAIAAWLAGGSDPSAPDRAGWTLLHFAAAAVAVKAAAALLDAGADIEAEDAHGNSPLWRAVFASQGDGGVVQLLRQRGADTRHANRFGQTPVSLARMIANYDVRRFSKTCSSYS